MSYPPPRLSTSSFASDFDVYSTGNHGYSYGPPPSSTGSASPPMISPRHSGSHQTAARSISGISIASSGRRSKARAFGGVSIDLSPPKPQRTPTLGASRGRRESDAFAGKEYEDALRLTEDEYEEDVVDGEYSRSTGGTERGIDALEEELGTGITGGKGRELGHALGGQPRRAYRQSFQPLTPEEMWWMSLSALAVLGLTVVACIVTALG
ncbi:hypothetical protein T439DRAFT_322489 [Meredithblackwellia eburnea MCA 4105]